MAELIQAVTWEGGLTLFRVPEHARRDLKVVVRGGADGARRDLRLPAGQDKLDVPDLGDAADCDLTVTPASLPARLRFGRQRLSLRAEPTPFRVLVSGSGRCGTQTLARWLDGMRFRDGEPVEARHESLAFHVLNHIVAGDGETVARVVTGQPHNVESSPFYAVAADRLSAGTIVQLVRDGRRVVQSGLNRGWYDNDTLWNRIKPRFADNRFENCCQFWRHANEELEKVADVRVRLEDLAADADVQARLLADLGIEASPRPFPHANKGKGSSAVQHWNDDQRAIFTEICGPVMDRYYPDWQESW